MLSILMLLKNPPLELLTKSLDSVKKIADEIVIVDNRVSREIYDVLEKQSALVFKNNAENLGNLRGFGLSKTMGDWILMLDADEIVSKELAGEIKEIMKEKNNNCNGYLIPYQNHFLGKKINHGGENYCVLRLFKKDAVIIKSSLLHEKVSLKKGKAANIKGKIYHYSYQSLTQVFKKFTTYAKREAEQKWRNKERVNIRKLFLNPLHMFWARFVEDRGYKDGVFRVPLDLAFAYMEFMTYVFLFYYNLKNKR